MKKIAVSVLAVLMALTTVIGMVGCGNSKEEQLLNAYVMSSDFQSNLKQMQSKTSELANVTPQVSGRKLTLVFRRTTQLSELEINTMKLQVSSKLDTLSTETIAGGYSFTEMAQNIREHTAIQYPIIGMEMYNMDNSAIVKLEYDSQTMQIKLV